jgi:short-subunit dehydrogenase
VAGCQPLPLHALYAATKSFDNLLGEALWGELRGTGVDVLVLEPGSTETEFQATSGEIAHAGESPAKVVGRSRWRRWGGSPRSSPASSTGSAATLRSACSREAS